MFLLLWLYKNVWNNEKANQKPLILNASIFCVFLFQLTGEVILQIANEPVLPFNALDVALEVQNSLKGNFSLNYRIFNKCKIV